MMTSEEAVKLGEELSSTRSWWEASGEPQLTMPCPNGKTWGELSAAERRDYELAMWWWSAHEWVAWQTKH
jgi:hypothetical protein